MKRIVMCALLLGGMLTALAQVDKEKLKTGNKQSPNAEASVTVTSAPVQSLIIRGSPPQAQSSWTGLKMLVALGLGLGVAALAVLGRLYMVRRAKPTELAATGKEELKMPRELLMKEPLNLPPEPMAVPEKS